MTRRGDRSAGRAVALQFLYQQDAGGGGDSPEGAVDGLLEHFAQERSERAREFARQLCHDVTQRQQEIDELLRQRAHSWRLERMSRVDRCVLRLAVHELTQPEGPPPPVVINEAVELARRFGAEGSASFVNGVLARVVRERGGGSGGEQ